MYDINELRKEIDEIDCELVKLFEKRMEVVEKVAKYKIDKNVPILNSSREKEVVDKNLKYLKNAQLQPYLKEFFINLMKLSKEIQNNIIKK